MTILLIEDNPADVAIIRELLSDQKGTSFDIICADRLSAAKPYLAAGGIDIILLDLGLPDSQGLDTFRWVRDLVGEVAIVVLTLLDNEETGLNALKEGAQDYLVKGRMDGPSIARTLRYAIERGRIEKELKKYRDSLEDLVAERTSQLAELNVELRRQYTALAKKDESIRALNRNLEKRVEERTSELKKANTDLENAHEELGTQFNELAEREKRLAESEERFRISAQSVSDVIWDWNILQGSVDWYGRIDAILGYAPGEFPRTPEAWHTIIHPADQEWVMSLRDSHVKSQTSYTAEYRVVRKDGEIRYLTDKGTAMLDENKRAYRMVGSCSDITDRKRAEEALLLKNEELDGYFTNTLDLLGIADADGHFRRLNREWESALGYRPAELEGKQFLDFVHPDDMEASLEAMAELNSGKTVLQFTNRYQHRDMSYRWIEWRLFPAGNLIYASARDVTERKLMTDLIEASLAEKETLLREIHHRVKNNLQIISSLLSLQINKINDPRTIEALKDSQTRVLSMALVHEHLYKGDDFSRIDMRDYIHALGTNLFQSYRDDNENILLELDIPEIYVDINTAIPMGLIINELITNSLKYAFKERNEGEISVTATEDAQSMTISVADDGTGMPEGVTLENQTSLGLRLVNKLTGQLRGTVIIDNTRGTKFMFTFPKRGDTRSEADDILRHAPDTLPNAAHERCVGV